MAQPDDDVEQLALLRERADAGAQASSAGLPDEPIEGLDGDRIVRVLVEPDGTLSRISIDEDWADEIDASALGAAVLDAASAAALARLARWGTEQAEAPSPSARPADPAAQRAIADLTERAAVTDTARLMESMETLARRFREFHEGFAETMAIARSRAEARFEGAVEGRSVVAAVNGAGGLLAVDIDPDWADRRSAHQIGDGVLSAVARAREAARAAAPAHPFDDTPLQRFARWDATPDGLTQLVFGED